MIHGSSPSPQALLETGFQSLQQGRAQEAWDAFHALLRLEPENALGHHMIGLIALQHGQLEMGVESLRRSIALDAGDPAAYGNLANGLRDLGRTDEALEAYAKALAMAPSFLDALHNRAVLYSRLGRFEEALADYDRALAQEGRIAGLHNARANALLALGRHTEALDSCGAALGLDPANGDAHLNRASVLAELGRTEEAMADYEACLTLQPGRLAALYYSGTAALTLGDYARGWARYEARKDFGGVRRTGPEGGFTQPQWTGQTPLQGKTILLHSEQGLGDTIQFCRYANLAKAQGATVILQVESALVSLLSTLEGADVVLPKGAALPDVDLHASLMSLPHVFGTRLETVPAEVPYLYAAPHKISAWGQKLGPKTRPRVGLAWSGGFQAERTDLRTVYQRRDIPLAMLAPLAGADVDFVSLQKGEPAQSELKNLVAAGWDGPALLDVAARLYDFSDTAALIEALDLVITVDTAVAHLAGALGKPVWILNRFDSCWRWMRGRSDSPWYPTARLFRQTTFGDWTPVVGEVVEALGAFRG